MAIDARRFKSAGLGDGRPPSFASQAMVVAPDRWAALIGVEVLREGGTAVDAAIAVSAALTVAMPHQTGLGGDAFWMIRKAAGPTEALNASGRAPSATDPDRLLAAGEMIIPPRSPFAVTVPGMIAGWTEAHERHGRLDLARLLEPAAAAAIEGRPVTPTYARAVRSVEHALSIRPEWRRVFLPGGRAPSVGERLCQPDLAATLRTLADNPHLFYRGHLADRISEAVRADGGWLATGDLAACRAEWVAAIARPFAEWTVNEMPPNSYGCLALLAMAIYEADGGSSARTVAQSTHRWIEAAKIMTLVRDAEVGDPAGMRAPIDKILDLHNVRRLAALISPTEARSFAWLNDRVLVEGDWIANRGGHADTCHFVVVDSEGTSVSCIQSLFDDFGTGLVVPGTGIVLQNRGACFTLQPGHPNTLTAGRRPLHTLAPALATVDDTTVAVFGAMGGHAQVQLHLQMVDGLALSGLNPAEVTDRPRWFVRPVQGEFSVLVENRLQAASELARMGHRLEMEGPYTEFVGHEQIVLLDHARGVLVGAADPRSDGAAVGY
jgi:gamma-glutamyltranspeptidase